MGDQTAIEPHDTPPFQGPYYPLTEGQRSGQVFCHDTLKEVGHFGSVPESSGTHNINSICCSNSSSVCSGRGTNACVSEDNGTLNNWIGHPLIHTQVDAGKFGSGAGRGRSQSDGYLPKWHPAYRHQGALGRGDGACEQKLDSFTEAFARRSPSMPPIQNGNRGAVFGMILGAGMGGVNSGLDSAGSVTDSSGPPAPHPPSLLLSPPPTPLSLGPLSPPKRTHFPTVQVTQLMQSAQSTQADAPCSSAQFCAGLQTYYPASLLAQPTNSPGPTLPGKCSPLDWVQQSDDPMGNGDTSYPHLQHRDSDQTLMYSGQEEFSVRHTPSNQHEDFRNTDHCSLQTPLSSPQGPYSQPCVSFQSDRNPMTTTDHVTSWCQEAPDRGTPLPYISPLPPCSMPSLPHLQGDGFRPVDGGKQDFGAEVTVSGTQCPTKGKNGSHLSYSGIPFTSILQAGRTAEAVFPGTLPHYTPRPMLNPIRRGTGLYCNLLPPSYLQSHCSNPGSLWPEEHCPPLPRVNVGPEYQAELPQFLDCRAHGFWPEESPREELLWKPWEELEESADLQEQVENLLDLCSSSAIPGGGTNLELALHCLSHCQGDMLATVEMLLMSTPSSSEDYHYCGSDVWMLSEKRLFNKAFATHSKDFSLIQKMVKTKCVSQCVEFYYLSKKIPEQQRKQREREKVEEEERSSETDRSMFSISNTMVKPLPMEGTIPSPSLSSSFPCKQCGKMFYKIKSRNAHMKIHRQQQEDWRDRAHPSQILTHNLSQGLPQTQARLAFLQAPSNHMSNISSTNPNTIPNAAALPTLFPSSHPAWDSFDLTPDPATFYYDPEGKVMLGMAGAKSQIRWQ